MDVVLRIVVGLLLLAHGLVHLLYFVTNADDPRFPFTITSSWLVPESARRPVAIVLVSVTIATFALLGLAVWGVPGLATVQPLLAVVVAVVRPGWTSWISAG